MSLVRASLFSPFLIFDYFHGLWMWHYGFLLHRTAKANASDRDMAKLTKENCLNLKPPFSSPSPPHGWQKVCQKQNCRWTRDSRDCVRKHREQNMTFNSWPQECRWCSVLIGCCQWYPAGYLPLKRTNQLVPTKKFGICVYRAYTFSMGKYGNASGGIFLLCHDHQNVNSLKTS